MNEDQREKPPRSVKRRTVLKLAGAAGLGLTLPSWLAGCESRGSADAPDGGGGETGDSLAVPPQLDGEVDGDVRVFRLNLQAGSVEWIAGNPTATYGINGPVLGPTLRFRRGERVRMEVTNSLSEMSTLHWHGMELPPRSDGGPYQPIEPGATWVSEYDVIQRPMTAWYHPHRMHETARHVHMGMAGLIYVDDPAQTIELPSSYGVDDVPLVIQDRRFASDGTHPYSGGQSPAMHDRMAGLKGDTILVNGEITPRGVFPQGIVRLRILNGSNARNYNLGFSDDRSFQLIASDGGLLEASLETTRVLLGPAERAEILVDFSADAPGTAVELRSYSGEVFDALFTGNMGAGLADSLDRTTFGILSLEVGQQPALAITPPTAFGPIARMRESDAVRMRPIEMSMGMGSVFINGSRMLDMDSVPDNINFRIPAGDTELWQVTNTSGMAHPLHIHHRHFQVLDIDGQAPPARLAGWKDTVLVQPGQVVRLLLTFDGSADPDYPYMFHCHILEHEDAGMMGQFYIVDP